MSRMAFTVLTSLALTGLIAGCYECDYPVGPAERGKIDLTYVEDWILSKGSDKEHKDDATRLVIRNLHNDEYYVELTDKNGDASRATGHLTKVGDTTFVSILPLTD